MKKILITGKDSYIGTSFERWVSKWPDRYEVDTVDMIGEAWIEKDFSGYDVVFHVAGIVHMSPDKKLKDLYYKVNRDLAVETANKAKSEGVKQFVFISTMSVYGMLEGFIDKDTPSNPKSYYGESKLQAEELIKALDDNSFSVAILRPPMVYGKGSKGNYPKLASFATKSPIFPDIDNKRSMLHIDNLCELIKLMIDNEERGLFFPQNKEYVRTSEMVRTIGEVHGKKIRMTKIFNPILKLMFKIGTVNKVFGNLVYEKSISEYEKGDYRVRDFRETIELTESGEIYHG